MDFPTTQTILSPCALYDTGLSVAPPALAEDYDTGFQEGENQPLRSPEDFAASLAMRGITMFPASVHFKQWTENIRMSGE
ncbi:MAG: hypothetical protein LQ352_006713 [Teloschistes flavicans]|nr:MAG: hypothetical protein LQ352_006713 [Teloschistes flavicans]